MPQLSAEQTWHTCQVWENSISETIISIMKQSHDELYHQTFWIQEYDDRKSLWLNISYDGLTYQIHTCHSVQRNIYSQTTRTNSAESINKIPQHIKEFYKRSQQTIHIELLKNTNMTTRNQVEVVYSVSFTNRQTNRENKPKPKTVFTALHK